MKKTVLTAKNSGIVCDVAQQSGARRPENRDVNASARSAGKMKGAAMYCSTCGAQNLDDSKFCQECGANLQDDVLQAEPSPVASYDSLGFGYTGSATEADRPKKKNGKLIALIAALLVAALAIGGIVAAKGCSAESPDPITEPEPVVESAIGKTKVSFSVNAPYYDEPGSRLRMQLTGTTAEGKAVSQTIYITVSSTIVTETLELEDGTYTYEATGSPISANGIIYDFSDIQGAFMLIAGEGNVDVPLAIEAELAPIDPAEVTDEEIEAAYQSALADDDCDNADELKATAETLRADAIQKAEAEAVAAERAAAINALADAYETILDDAPSYFGEYYNEYPVGDYEYAFFDVTGDGINDLLLMAQYDNLGHNKSRVTRIIPFLYWPEDGSVVMASEDLISEMYNEIVVDSVSGELIERNRYDMPYTYSRIRFDGYLLVRESIPGDDYVDLFNDMSASISDGSRVLSVSDKSPIDQMRNM